MKESKNTKNAACFRVFALIGAPILGVLALPCVKAQPPATANQPLPISDAEIEKLSGPPTRLTVNFQDTPLKEALAEISRQAGCIVDAHDYGGKGQFDDVKVTLQATQMPFWQVMEKLLTPQNLAISSPPSRSFRDVQGQSVDLNVRKVVQQADAVAPPAPHALIPPLPLSPFVTLKTIGATRNQSRTAKYDGVASASSDNNNLSLNLAVMLDPRLKNLPVQTQVTLDTITFDNGEEMNAFPSRSRSGGLGDDGLVQSHHISLMPNLTRGGRQTQTPDANTPKKLAKIARLTGRVTVAVETRHQMWEIENVQDTKNLSKTFTTTNGLLKATVIGFWGETGHYRVPLRIERQKTTPAVIRAGQPFDLFDATFARWHQKARLLDANGGAYSYGGGGGNVRGDGQNEIASYDINFADPSQPPRRPDGAPKADPLGAPQKLIFQIPLEVRQMEIPFEVRDLPLP